MTDREDETTCCECGRPSEWVRRTQFSGSHPFCDEHARKEKDFGKEDSSYFFWEHVEPATPVSTSGETARKGEGSALLSLLKKLEWAGDERPDYPCCAVCKGRAPYSLFARHHPTGHAPDCSLAAAIKRLEGEKPAPYSPEVGDNEMCKCGHVYYRHFDTYDKMAPIGCKHCDCREFTPASHGLLADLKGGPSLSEARRMRVLGTSGNCVMCGLHSRDGEREGWDLVLPSMRLICPACIAKRPTVDWKALAGSQNEAPAPHVKVTEVEGRAGHEDIGGVEYRDMLPDGYDIWEHGAGPGGHWRITVEFTPQEKP